MPWRHRLHWPQPAWISTLTRSPILNSSTSGPSAAIVPIYSCPGVKFLLKGKPPRILAGDPLWMISRSVAQIATASMRTKTSARLGTGVGLSCRKSSSGPPRTQAFIRSGMGISADVRTPAGSYIATVLVHQAPRERATDRSLIRDIAGQNCIAFVAPIHCLSERAWSDASRRVPGVFASVHAEITLQRANSSWG